MFKPIASIALLTLALAGCDSNDSVLLGSDPEGGVTPQALSEQLMVMAEGAQVQRFLGDLPAPTTDDATPVVIIEDPLTIVPGEDVEVPFTLTIDGELEALFVKVRGADDYLRLTATSAQSLARSGKDGPQARVAVTREGIFTISLPEDTTAEDFILDIAVQDDAGLVSEATSVDATVGNGTSPGASEVLAALQGTWESGCIPVDASTSGIRRLTFQDDTMQEENDEFGTANCSGSPSETFNAESSFTLGASRTNGDGLSVNDFDAVFTTSDAGVEDIGLEYFDILRVDGNLLYFGTVNGDFATNANDRPQMLNFDEVYTKQ